MEIIEPTKDFNFAKLSLMNPQIIQDGTSYFSKIAFTNSGNNNKDKSLYIQLPKCKTKQGIVTTKKEKYCDLVFEKNGTSETDDLLEWIDHLEKKCQELIDSKKKIWFHNDITLEDIENMMTPICRLYKSGKSILLRTFIDVVKKTGKEKCLVYDERENVLSLDDIKETQYVIPLLLVDGIIFSTKSFEISIKAIQFMVCENDVEEDEKEEDVNKCLITKKDQTTITTTAATSQTQVTSETVQSTTVQAATEVVSASPIEIIPSSSTSSIVNTVSEIKQTNHDVKVNQELVDEQELVVFNEKLMSESKDNIFKKVCDNNIINDNNKNNIEEIEEVQFDFDNIKETVIIKSANEIYKNLISNAIELKQKYINALLVAKKFKEKYKLKDNTHGRIRLYDLEDEVVE